MARAFDQADLEVAVELVSTVVGGVTSAQVAHTLRQGGKAAAAIWDLVDRARAGAAGAVLAAAPAVIGALWKLVEAALAAGQVKLVVATADPGATHTAVID